MANVSFQYDYPYCNYGENARFGAQWSDSSITLNGSNTYAMVFNRTVPGCRHIKVNIEIENTGSGTVLGRSWDFMIRKSSGGWSDLKTFTMPSDDIYTVDCDVSNYSITQIACVPSSNPGSGRTLQGGVILMKGLWSTIQIVFSLIGGWLGWFLGGCDGLLYALIAFVVLDYITELMCAVGDKTLSSEIGFRGICRKVLIFFLVGIGNILDANVIGNGSILRTAVIFFYLSNEGVSILENAAANSLGIEICINSDGDYSKAFDNAVWLAKKLMTELDIPLNRVVRHYDASRKNCPASMSKNNWALWSEFKKRLTEEEIDMEKLNAIEKDVAQLSLSEFNKLTKINHDAFLPLFVEIMPKIC